jgi:histone-lysine N-methyltransferase SUV39H
MGLGVRTMEPIPRGTFVAEYVGERVSEATIGLREEIYNELGLMYSFALDYGVTECD